MLFAKNTQMQAEVPATTLFQFAFCTVGGLWIYGSLGDCGRVDSSSPVLQLTRLQCKIAVSCSDGQEILPVLTDFSAQLSPFHQKNNGLLKSIDTTKIKYVNNFLFKSCEVLCALSNDTG